MKRLHPNFRILFAACGLLAAVCLAPAASASPVELPDDGDRTTWEDHAGPLLRSRCAACHNPDKKSADLDLSSYSGIMAGGASGAAIEAGDPAASWLYKLVTHAEEPSMPPGGTKIPDAEIATLEKWIAGGALETKSSRSQAKKKGPAMAGGGNSLARPETVTVFPRLKLEPVLRLARGGTVSAMNTHPWAPLIAVAVPQQILLFDTNSLQLTGILPFPEGQAQVVRFSRNGQIFLAGGGRDGAAGKVVLWDVASGQRVSEIGSELDTVLAADISSDHSLVALGGPQKVVRVFSTADASLRYEIRKHTDWITALEFSPDGVLLASGDRNGGLFVWHAPTGNDYLTLNGHTAAIAATTWRMDSNVLVSASEDTTFRAWEMENGGQIKSVGAHGGGVTAALFDRDNNLYTSGRDMAVKSWNPAGDPIRTFAGLADIATSVAVSVESGRAFGGDWQGNLAVWNLADGAEVGRLALNPPGLADRLANAQQALAAVTTTHQAASAEMGQLQEQLEKARADHEAARNAVEEMNPTITAMQQVLSGLSAEHSALQKQASDLQAELTTLEAVVPELEKLAEQAQKVAALAPADAQLATSSEQIAGKLGASRTRIGEIASAIPAMAARVQEIEVQKTGLDQKMSEDQSKLTALTATADSLMQQVVAVEKTVADAGARLQGLSQQLAVANGEVARWTGELEFVASWDRLAAEIAVADAEVNVAMEARGRILDEIARLQAAVDAATAGVAAAEEKRTAIETQFDTLRGISR